MASPERTIRAIRVDEPRLRDLADEARDEGHAFLDRMIEDWRNGSNRFDKPGECYLGVFMDGELTGCGGLNRDPYEMQEFGRLRHLYIPPRSRRSGHGTALVSTLLDRAEGRFAKVRLSTRNPIAARFYRRLGVETVNDPDATHIIDPAVRPGA